MQIEQSETLKNLINAFAGESQARNRYTIYAKVAKKEGYEYISQVFLDTSENEREHAKLFYKHIPNSEHWKVEAEYPFFLGSTAENLFAAAKGEREEWENIYRYSAKIALEEGFDEISNLFSGILEIEKRHAHRFEFLGNLIKEKAFFTRNEKTQWLCRKCGHVQISQCAPKICPICKHEQGYFEIYCDKI